MMLSINTYYIGIVMGQFFEKQLIIQKNGFTLIELVAILIILGVLMVIAIPKLTDQSSFEDFTIQDQLISRLKLVQLQAMNTPPFDNAAESNNMCHWLVVKPDCFYNESTAQINGKCNLPQATNVCVNNEYNQYNQVSFTEGLLDTAEYRFDNDGLIHNISGSTPININGQNKLSINIETEGYIHGSVEQ